MRIIAYIFWLIILLAVVVFTIINSQIVTLNLYFTTIHFYLPLLLLITLMIGALLGALCLLPIIFRHKSRSRKYKSRMHQAEKEVNNLRSIPIKDQH